MAEFAVISLSRSFQGLDIHARSGPTTRQTAERLDAFSGNLVTSDTHLHIVAGRTKHRCQPHRARLIAPLGTVEGVKLAPHCVRYYFNARKNLQSRRLEGKKSHGLPQVQYEQEGEREWDTPESVADSTRQCTDRQLDTSSEDWKSSVFLGFPLRLPC